MKADHLLLVVTALVAHRGFAFIPNRIAWQPLPRSSVVNQVRVSGPLLSTPQGDVPLDTKAIIAAYEEWRSKFSKGDFDIRRFHNFENNYRVLTAANIKARDKALAEGNAPPQWLELNEYGDYARDEYKAMLEKGEMSPNSSAPGASSVRRTQVIVPPRSKSASQSPKQSGVSYGTQVVQKIDPGLSKGQPTSSTSGVTGLYGPPSKDIATPSPSFGTQVVRQDAKSAPAPGVPKATGVSALYGPPSTSVPPSSSPPPGTLGTEVIQPKVNGARGTEVISATPAGGIGGSSRAPLSSGMAVPRGTQVILKVSATSSSVNGLYGPPPSVAGSGAAAPRGTQVIQKMPGGTGFTSNGSAENPWIPTPVVDERGTYVVQGGRGFPPNAAAPRGTRVIPTEGTTINDFMSSSSKIMGRGTQVIREATKRTGAMMESSGGSDMIRQFSDSVSKSIFSLFGGQKSDKDASRSVRGTVKIQGDQGSSSEGTEGKKTVLIDMEELQQKVPSIFSFFGGSKTEEKIVEAPAPITGAPPQAPSRPTLVIDRNYVEFPGDVTGLPELRRWWQGADGTVTGFIYNSKNFNDGTKLTSSKLQRAACKPGNILRSGGQDYLLK